MIDIGSTTFLLKVPSLPEKEFERYSSYLFDQWETSVETSLTLPDYSIFLEIEEGSVSGKAKVYATAGALFLGVANYGGFISGTQIVRDQVSYANNALFELAKSAIGCSNKDASVRKSGGSLAKLQSVFHKLQGGALTTDEAMVQVIEIFGEEGERTPNFVEQLRRELENAPQHPQQLSFIEEAQDECDQAQKDSSRMPSKKRTPEPIPASQQFRIEIWRESKKDKKHVKLIKK